MTVIMQVSMFGWRGGMGLYGLRCSILHFLVKFKTFVTGKSFKLFYKISIVKDKKPCDDMY